MENNYILDFWNYMPIELLLTITSIIALVVGLSTQDYPYIKNGKKIILKRKNAYVVTHYLLFSYIILFFAWIYLATSGKDIITYEILESSIHSNNVIFLFKLIMMLLMIIYYFVSLDNYRRNEMESFEYPVLISIVNASLFFLISANDLIVLFLAMELQALSFYILVAYVQKRNASVEAALKYFTVGAVATGVYLLGSGFIYVTLGTINLSDISQLIINLDFSSSILPIAFTCIFVTFFFKLSLAPFHFWAPDVYEGAKSLFAMYLATIPKIAILTLIMKFVSIVKMNTDLYILCSYIFAFVGIISLIIGIFSAYNQTRIRSFIAFSSMVNLAFIFTGLSAQVQADAVWEDIMFVFIYAVSIYISTVFALFHILNYLYNESTSKPVTLLSQLSGLAKQKGMLALIFAIQLFSLMGIPPLAGFFGKFYVILGLAQNGNLALALFLLLSSILAALYYLRVIKLFYFDKPNRMLLPNVTGYFSYPLVLITIFQLSAFYYTDMQHALYIYLHTVH